MTTIGTISTTKMILLIARSIDCQKILYPTPLIFGQE